MRAIDEDLRHGATAAGTLDHLLAERIVGDVDLVVRNRAFAEQTLRLNAVGAHLRRVHDHPRHDRQLTDASGLSQAVIAARFDNRHVPRNVARMSRFHELVDVVRRLRGPDGCPWDREQTPQSLRGCLLEESYEALDALDRDDPTDLRDELGDLLLQIIMQADMAAAADRFTIEDVITGVIDKMVRRHPHVFGDVTVTDTAEVLRNWSRIKTAERASKGAGTDTSILSGLPRELPALHAAHRIGEKAARVGFDWSTPEAAMAKVHEEIGELQEALQTGVATRVAHELGDTLFALASVGRLADQNAEVALREALTRFARRFRGMERVLAATGRDIHTVPQPELEALWDAEKAAEREHDPDPSL